MIELNRIYHEDCLQGMRRIPDASIDLVVCDLPYGVLNRSNPHAVWDIPIPFQELWKHYQRILKLSGAVILFGQGMFTAQMMLSNIPMWRYNLIYQKGGRVTGFLNARRMPLREHEDICVFYRKQPTYNPQMISCEPHQRNHLRGKNPLMRNRCYGAFGHAEQIITDLKYPRSIISFLPDHKEPLHPTQKPVALIEWIVKTYSNPGDTVLDNCMGSGTTAIACINTGRNFIGFELDQKYFDISVRRISEHTTPR